MTQSQTSQSQTSESRKSLIGTSIGNYSIVSRLGEGAMGEVYLGEHPDIGRKVAIKVLISSLSSNREMANRFISEAKAVNKINHPNIIQIFDFGKLSDGRLYYTMEYLEGKELTKLIQNEAPLTLERTTWILGQIAAALDAAHAAGVVHRDLKPDNIFVYETPTGEMVKVLDFGIAKLLGSDLGAQHKTSTGMIMGTPMYMSPEQAAGDNDNISPRSDIYAFGVIAYELLSGLQPFNAPSVAQLLAKHITDPPMPLAQTTQGLPFEVCIAVEKTLVKNPDGRFQTAGEFFQNFSAASTLAPGSTMARVLNPNARTAAGGVANTGPAPGSGPYSSNNPYASSPGTPGVYVSHPPPPNGSLGADPGAASQAGASTMNPPKNRAPLFAGLVLLGLAVLGGGGFIGYRFLFAPTPSTTKRASAEKKRTESADEKNNDNSMEATVGKDQIEIYPVKVASKTPGVKIQVTIAGQATMTKSPPFTIEVGRGERIVLRARGEGLKPATETFIAQEKREIIFDLEKEKPQDPEKKITARRRRRKTTRKTAASRRTSRKPPREGKKTRVGPGTMTMD